MYVKLNFGLDTKFKAQVEKTDPAMFTLLPTIAGTLPAGVFLERLESCDGKLSSTVLRRVVGGLTACAYPVPRRGR